MIDQEISRLEAVEESTKAEEIRKEVLKETIEIETDLIDVQQERVANLKQIGAATLEAFKSISASILEIRKKEAEEKMALIDKELEHTIGALQKEREEKLIAAGFAVANNEQSLEAQLETARDFEFIKV